MTLVTVETGNEKNRKYEGPKDHQIILKFSEIFFKDFFVVGGSVGFVKIVNKLELKKCLKILPKFWPTDMHILVIFPRK